MYNKINNDREGMNYGVNFRKSLKVGKNTRVNLSKGGGIGLSTGVKGLRVSANKKGIRQTASIPKAGIYSTKQTSWNSKDVKNSNKNSYERESSLYSLPDGIFIPSYPRKIKVLILLGCIMLLMEYFHPIFILGSLITLISGISIMLLSKEFKISFNMQRAILKFKSGKLRNSYELCNKVLRLDSNNLSATILANRIEEISEGIR